MPQADSRSITPKIYLPLQLPQAARAQVVAAIKQHMAATEALMTFLDEIDSDNELEAEHDGQEPDKDMEPSLAHTNDLNQEMASANIRANFSCDVDREAKHDGREPEDEGDELDRGELDTADDEPLAHPETCGGTYGAPGANWGRP